MSRLWIGLGVITGAAIAYRWRSLVSARFLGQSRERLPEQIDLPVRPISVSALNPED